jgi:hypothetical protein
MARTASGMGKELKLFKFANVQNSLLDAHFFLYPPQKNFQVLLMSVALVSGALPLVCRVVTKDYKSKDGDILMKDDESMFLLSVSAEALFEP